MSNKYILDNDRLELLARSDESQFFSGDLVSEIASNVLQLQKRIAELEAAQRWIPVSERLPEDNVKVLVSATDIVSIGSHQSSVPQWSGDAMYYHGQWYKMVTHWMPLPLTTGGNQMTKHFNEAEEYLADQLRENSILFDREVKFCADFLIGKLIVEINGGTWMQKSGHASAKGIQRDYQKLNAAQIAEFMYLQFVPEEVYSGMAIEIIKRVVGSAQCLEVRDERTY